MRLLSSSFIECSVEFCYFALAGRTDLIAWLKFFYLLLIFIHASTFIPHPKFLEVYQTLFLTLVGIAWIAGGFIHHHKVCFLKDDTNVMIFLYLLRSWFEIINRRVFCYLSLSIKWQVYFAMSANNWSVYSTWEMKWKLPKFTFCLWNISVTHWANFVAPQWWPVLTITGIL